MKLWNRIRFWLTRTRLDSELADEIGAHREMLERQLRGEGLSPADAHAAARRRFGNDLGARERSRDEWGFAWLEPALRDARFALRLLRHQPLVTVAAIVTVGLAVGANTAIVSVLRTALLDPLGIRDAGNIMVASVRLEKLQMTGAETSAVEYRELQEMTDTFSAVAASEPREWTAELGGQPSRMLGRGVTPDYFRVFGEHPLAGRFFHREDRETVAVISYGLWQTQFAASPSAIGTVLMLDGRPYRIVGVAGPRFHVPAGVQAWVPVVFSPDRLRRRGYNMIESVFARLRDGVTPARAADRVNRYVAGLKTSNDPTGMAHLGYFIDLDSFSHFVAGDLRRPLWLLWAAASTVLLVGCANVALLLTSRTAGRRREMAIRLAVGATRWQLLRQLSIESSLLGLLSGLAGIAVAALAVSLIGRLAMPGKALLELVSLDRRLMLYGLAIALACSLASGIAPALQLLRTNQAAAMVRSARRGFQRVFLAAEVAATVVLLVGTSLLLRSLWALEQVRPGFDSSHLATGFLLRPPNDPGFLDRLDRNLRALPGVESAALAYPIPFSGGGETSGFSIQGRQHFQGQPEFHGEAYFVSAAYFATLRIPLVSGRALADSDTAAAPRVCVVDSLFASRFFPGGSPIGSKIAMFAGWAQIVGVVGSIHGTALDHSSRPTIYYSMPQIPYFPSRAVILRTSLPDGPLIRQAVKQTNASVPVFDVRSMEDRIAESLGIRRILGILVSVFGALCLLLAMVGLHGVVSQIVGERTVEIGVRLALGARPAQILAYFLGYGLAAGGTGLVLGLAGAGWAQQWLAGLLYEVRPFDPPAFAAAALAVLTTLLAAVFWPARRASRIDPQRALRYE